MTPTIQRPVIPYYGGKCSKRKWLGPILDSIPHKCYCSAFGGAGGDILSRSEPAKSVCWNDIDGTIATLFRVLRSDTLRPQLIERLGWTEYSQSCVREAVGILKRYDSGETPESIGSVLLAWALQTTCACVISTYPCAWSDRFEDSGWKALRHEVIAPSSGGCNGGGTKARRTELLLLNPVALDYQLRK